LLKAHGGFVSPPFTVVKLSGGIGNQLFGLSVALLAKSTCHSETLLDVRNISTHDNSSVKSFVLPIDFTDSNRNFMLKSSLFALDLRVMFSKILRRAKLLSDPQLNHYFSSRAQGGGFDDQLMEWIQATSGPLATRYIEGYFQTFKYFRDFVQSKDFQLTLRNPSYWFQSMYPIAERHRPTAIHVRRGDYRDQRAQQVFGLLDKQYFLDAISLVRSKEPKPSEIWIFSDSISEVRAELEPHIPDALFVETPKDVDAAEVLLIMAACGSLVISNSTFGYWAGLVSKTAQFVVAPTKWFKGQEDPEQLVPPDWHRVTSRWKP